MSGVTLNGGAVSGLRLKHSQAGAWHADVSLLPSSDVPDGAAVLDLFGATYAGTVFRAGTSRGIPMARLVGGAGGLGTVLPPRAYQGIDAKLALSEILSAVGERLSSTSDMTALAARLPFWIRRQAAAGAALASLLAVVGIPAWRVLADGTVWAGTESWPASALVDFQMLVQDPHIGRYDIYASTPNVYPGEVWNGMQVSVVEHNLTTTHLRTSVWVHT